MNNLTDLLRETIETGKKYLALEVDVVKLTLAEKLTLLFSGLVVAIVFLTGFCFIVLLLAFAAADFFKEYMSPAMAYVATAGIVAIFLLTIYLMRKWLIINPIAKMVTKLVFKSKL